MDSQDAQMTKIMVDEFDRAAQQAAARVERVERNPQSLGRAIASALGGLTPVLLGTLEGLATDFRAVLERTPGRMLNLTSGQPAQARGGITTAFAGVARTGSVCVDLSSEMDSMASLLPQLHIAILPAERIVPRPRDLFRGGNGMAQLPENFVFVTGPSATADMGPLVRGVHGPRELHVIVLESEVPA